jgi:hypothetical protein
MNLADLRTAFGDYRPGHCKPVDLRIAMGHDTGTAFVPPSNLLRIHGTGLQTLALLAVLARDGFTTLDMIDADLCSEKYLCTHSYWRAPVTLMPDVVLAAAAALPGSDDTVPYAEAIEVPLLDAGGYLACGCHGSQREHTCTDND